MISIVEWKQNKQKPRKSTLQTPTSMAKLDQMHKTHEDDNTAIYTKTILYIVVKMSIIVKMVSALYIGAFNENDRKLSKWRWSSADKKI